MTVEELIEALEEMPLDAEVRLSGFGVTREPVYCGVELAAGVVTIETQEYQR